MILATLNFKEMIIQIIKVKSSLQEEELISRAKEREPGFKAIPGLLQKYYVKLSQSGQYGGVYVWDSKESMQAYKESELAASIPKAYEAIEAPDIEVMDVLFKLRP
jgi:heme-degrading monooxygenase HmoA